MRLSDPNERAVIEDMLLESGRSLAGLCARHLLGDGGYGAGGGCYAGDGSCDGEGDYGDETTSKLIRYVRDGVGKGDGGGSGDGCHYGDGGGHGDGGDSDSYVRIFKGFE